MNEERSRIDGEREAKAERERAQAAERESRVRIKLETEALAAARERDRLIEEERRRAEEQARLDGIRTAEVTRVRDEAARRTALESSMLKREHELKLAAMKHTASARTMRLGLVATTLFAFAACAAFAWFELGVRPQRLAKLEADYRGLTEGERTRAERAEDALRTSEAVRRGLEERVRMLEAAPAAPTPAATQRTPPTRLPPHGGKPPRDREAPCKGDEHDPLNPCLKR